MVNTISTQKQENINFIRLLLCTICKLDICCAISGTCPAYVAGMFSSYFAVTLCVAKHTSVIIDPLSEMSQNFMIGPFQFQLHENHVNVPDFKVYNITYENISVLFQIISIDTTTECGPRSCFNFVDLILELFGLI